MNFIEKIKHNPKMHYAFSICASWAGVGSLMNSSTLANQYGIIPAMLWGLGNVLACILFGLVCWYIPTMRKLMKTKVMKWFIGFLCLFQSWTQLNGITTAWGETPCTKIFGVVLCIIAVVGFTVLYLKHAMLRNILTDEWGWFLVYGLVLVITIASFIITGHDVNPLSLGLEPENLKIGFTKGLLLLCGPFTYPYFFEILDYNDDNTDGTKKCVVRDSFIWGGILFGIYMIFAFSLCWVKFTPALSVVKALALTFIALSSLSTYIYSMYIAFGKKVGFAFNILTLGLWKWIVPLGVWGVWNLMAEIRVWVILAIFLIALIIDIYQKKTGKTVLK